MRHHCNVDCESKASAAYFTQADQVLFNERLHGRAVIGLVLSLVGISGYAVMRSRIDVNLPMK